MKPVTVLSVPRSHFGLEFANNIPVRSLAKVTKQTVVDVFAETLNGAVAQQELHAAGLLTAEVDDMIPLIGRRLQLPSRRNSAEHPHSPVLHVVACDIRELPWGSMLVVSNKAICNRPSRLIFSEMVGRRDRIGLSVNGITAQCNSPILNCAVSCPNCSTMKWVAAP